jgi:hypothetical protein
VCVRERETEYWRRRAIYKENELKRGQGQENRLDKAGTLRPEMTQNGG